MICPACATEIIYRFGKTVKGEQRFVCFTCGREFDRRDASPTPRRTL